MTIHSPNLGEDRPTRWYVLLTAALASIMATGTVATYALGVVGPLLVRDLDLTRTQLGSLTTALILAGCLLAGVSGRVADHVGAVRVAYFILGTGAVAVFAMAAAPSYPWLVAASALAGVSMAGIDPATNRLITGLVPRRLQGMVIGVKQSGVQVGALLTGAVMPLLSEWRGWRLAMASTAVLPALGTAATWFALGARPAQSRAGGGRRGWPPEMAPVWWLSAYACFMSGGLAPAGAYLPLYGTERIGLDLPAAGAAAAVMGFCGLVGRIAWASASQRAQRPPRPLALLAVGSVAAAVLVWGAGTWGAWAFWSGTALMGATAGAWASVGALMLVREVTPEYAGTASGIMQTCFYAGYMASPILFGYAADRTNSYGLAWGLVAALFLVGLLVAVAWDRVYRPGATQASEALPATGLSGRS